MMNYQQASGHVVVTVSMEAQVSLRNDEVSDRLVDMLWLWLVGKDWSV